MNISPYNKLLGLINSNPYYYIKLEV